MGGAPGDKTTPDCIARCTGGKVRESVPGWLRMLSALRSWVAVSEANTYHPARRTTPTINQARHFVGPHSPHVRLPICLTALGSESINQIITLTQRWCVARGVVTRSMAKCPPFIDVSLCVLLVNSHGRSFTGRRGTNPLATCG